MIAVECTCVHKSMQIVSVVWRHIHNYLGSSLLISEYFLMDNYLQHNSCGHNLSLLFSSLQFLRDCARIAKPYISSYISLILSSGEAEPKKVWKVRCVNSGCSATRNDDIAWFNGIVCANEDVGSVNFLTSTSFNVTRTSKVMICFDRA